MKIECTKQEKEFLIQALTGEDTLCIFSTGICYGYGNCEKCLNERIDWEITDSEET